MDANNTNSNNQNKEGDISIEGVSSLELRAVKDERIEVGRVYTKEGRECTLYTGTNFSPDIIVLKDKIKEMGL